MSAAFTPGPWEWGYNPHCRTDMPRLVSESGEVVCEFGNCERYYPTEGTPPSLANSRLIASAPELLEALILMVRTHDEPAESTLQEMKEQLWLAKARAVIAKAIGEQP